MKNTAGRQLTLTRYACKVAAQKGITPTRISDTFSAPTQIARGTVDGQYAISRDGTTIVGFPVGDSKFIGITLKG